MTDRNISQRVGKRLEILRAIQSLPPEYAGWDWPQDYLRLVLNDILNFIITIITTIELLTRCNNSF